MSLELALYIGLLFHILGDYITQNNWMVQNKTKDNFVAMLHAFIYSIPFYFLLGVNSVSTMIFYTHAVIDRFDLAQYWIKLVNNGWGKSNYGYGDNNMPPVLAIVLKIVIDNFFHIAINSLIIWYHFKT